MPAKQPRLEQQALAAQVQQQAAAEVVVVLPEQPRLAEQLPVPAKEEVVLALEQPRLAEQLLVSAEEVLVPRNHGWRNSCWCRRSDHAGRSNNG